MIETGRALLRQLLAVRYEDWRRRLVRRLGSVELATEVLHETWLRLDSTGEPDTLREPQSYLYRMMLNVAADRRRAEKRWASREDLEALQHADDDLLDPERIVAARSEIKALERVLGELPPLRRAIFVAATVEGQSYRLIAAHFGISLRTVEREMRRAVDHCSKRLDKKVGKPGGSAPSGNV